MPGVVILELCWAQVAERGVESAGVVDLIVSPRPNAESVMRQLPSWITHYNEVHPHKALGYRSPREFIVAHERP